jgi:AcrR family transcriptional regulator
VKRDNTYHLVSCQALQYNGHDRLERPSVRATTREQFIAAAQHLFAERGFYGTSIAAIAEELGLTKQALLHHFGSKEKLYGEVLQRLSGPLLESTREIAGSEMDPAEQLEELVVAQYRGHMHDQDAARLIMRELLDNEQRAAQAEHWYLKTYLDTLVETVLAIESTRAMDRARALAVVYQLLGAAHYFAVSQPTLTKIFSTVLYREAQACFEQELRLLVRAGLAS